MATDEQNLADLLIARDNIIQLIKTITLKPKPNYSVDGQRVDWSDYLEMLTRQAAALLKLIQQFDDPYETTSTIYT